MATVSQLLATKGHTVHTIDKSATVFEAIDRMVANNVGCLVVVDEFAPCGVITERDYLRKIALKGRASKTTLVAEIMSHTIVFVDMATEVEECMSLMTRERIRHLPVFSNTELVGLISIGDIVKYLARDRKTTIEELTAYIQGSPGAYA
jgi:CBS domain-containing protein